MAYIIRDTNPQYGGNNYFVGCRKILDPKGHPAEAADFGDKANAKNFATKKDAEQLACNLNKIANNTQFVVEELSIYNHQYGKGVTRGTNGFSGFGTLPEEQPTNGGFIWQEPTGGYNGF